MQHNQGAKSCPGKSIKMKTTLIILVLTLLAGCDPYGFGFKQNPAYVLYESYNAIKTGDVKKYLSVTGKEALCLYGHKAGLEFLKTNLVIDEKNSEIKLVPKVLETTHYNSPKFVGYWSYYHERYGMEITSKLTGEVLVETVVDCEYGIEGAKNAKWIKQKPAKYKKKECKAIKLIPQNFEPLVITEKCEALRVEVYL